MSREACCDHYNAPKWGVEGSALSNVAVLVMLFGVLNSGLSCVRRSWARWYQYASYTWAMCCAEDIFTGSASWLGMQTEP